MNALQLLPGLCKAVARTLVRRVRHGALRPGWTYAFETTVACMGSVPLMPDAASTRGLRGFLEKTASSGPSSDVVTHTRVDAGGVPASWVTPVKGSGEKVILFLHGGAYVVGSAKQYQAFCGELARDSGMRVLVPDYRLAPEHPYPAALEDALAVWRWLRSTGVEPSRVVLAGDSAGGGLAVALLVALAEAGEPMPVGAVLLSPWVDLACESRSHEENAAYDYLNRPQLLTWARFYAGALELKDPRVSPLHASLRGLPPLYLQVGGVELFRDEVCQLAERARAAGVPVELDVCAELPHVPSSMRGMTPTAREAHARSIAALVRMAKEGAAASAPVKAAG
ncbi:alpha/beta hydrolase [Archangium violaceum]|uniref:alpha/beta hydrolase n=1 Tax=Archangium violaceum TaxID=83451 RepID=UPI00193C454A|nr:alpha/beta hydrolase [Archangium violaceum]QRK11424.1 alpha/beta hydrolase [Archangium violaceum]